MFVNICEAALFVPCTFFTSYLSNDSCCDFHAWLASAVWLLHFCIPSLFTLRLAQFRIERILLFDFVAFASSPRNICHLGNLASSLPHRRCFVTSVFIISGYIVRPIGFGVNILQNFVHFSRLPFSECRTHVADLLQPSIIRTRKKSTISQNVVRRHNETLEDDQEGEVAMRWTGFLEVLHEQLQEIVKVRRIFLLCHRSRMPFTRKLIYQTS